MIDVSAEGLSLIFLNTALARNRTLRHVHEIARLTILSRGEPLPDIEAYVNRIVVARGAIPGAPRERRAARTGTVMSGAERTRMWRAKRRCGTEESVSVTSRDEIGDAVTSHVTAGVTARHAPPTPPRDPDQDPDPSLVSYVYENKKSQRDLGSNAREAPVTAGVTRSVTPVTKQSVTASPSPSRRPPPSLSPSQAFLPLQPPRPAPALAPPPSPGLAATAPLTGASMHGAMRDGVGGLAVAGWCDGIRSVTGSLFFAPRGTELDLLVEVLVGIGPDAELRTQKAFDDGAAYARACKGGKLSGYSYRDWVNGTRPERGSGIMRKAALKQPHSTAWKIGGGRTIS